MNIYKDSVGLASMILFNPVLGMTYEKMNSEVCPMTIEVDKYGLSRVRE